MELRVWLEGGPQRVVCGVTEATTCQDVVYALAQATAQTGRFALVERSRRAERALAPSDRPLRLLARWGRCASDVHFLLRRCGPPAKGDAATQAATATAMLRGGSQQQQQPPPEAPPRLEGPTPRPRRPPPYDEAVTRLAVASSSPRGGGGGEGALLLGESPSKARQPAAAEEEEEEEESKLLRVVTLQRERLQGLQEELAQRDAELCRWGGEAPLEEQLRLSQQEERTLRSELTLARSQLANCETRLLQCRQRLCQLGHDLAEEQQQQRCRAASAEVSSLLLPTPSAEQQQQQPELLERRLAEQGELLSERHRLLAQLSEELRQANLESLSLADADHKHWLEGAGGFFNRPGSTRKIVGSPRQLESAVPTSKNPNGVWV
uniref:Putative signal transduction n=1 Tax=Amblyomma aureolatum TaxID=187763 RepID=A0A1E1XGP7_9ACAR